LISSVSNTYRPRILVAAEMVKLNLVELLPAVHAVHHLQRTALGVVAQTPFQPINECLRFIHDTEPNQRVKCERRVSQPGVAIVPVPHSPYVLRQRKSRRSDQRSVFPADQQLQDQRRAIDHFSPPSLVLRLTDPLLPEVGSLLKALSREFHFRFLA